LKLQSTFRVSTSVKRANYQTYSNLKRYVTEFSSELCMMKVHYQQYQSRRHTSI